MTTARTDLKLEGLPREAAVVIEAFADGLVERLGENLICLAITGSVLTPDYVARRSDINSIIVVRGMDMDLLEDLAALGKHHGKKGIRAPLIMTPEYIQRSRDVFPLEFLEIRLLHLTVFGEECFDKIPLEPAPLRHQCERDLKARLIHLRQGYIAAAGDTREITALLLEALPGYFPLLRAILLLTGWDEALPQHKPAVLEQADSRLEISTSCLNELLALRARKRPALDRARAQSLFKNLYDLTDALAVHVDALHV